MTQQIPHIFVPRNVKDALTDYTTKPKINSPQGLKSLFPQLKGK